MLGFVLRTRRGLLSALFCLGTFDVAHAASFDNPGVTDVIRDRQDRLLEEQRRRLEELKDLPGKTAAPVTPPVLLESRCFPIKTIELKGADSLSEGERTRLLRPYIGQCLGVPQLNELLKVITDRYIEKGLVTSRAYLPQQDLSGGKLKVLVVEGKLEGLKGADGNGISDRQLAMTFPGQPGDLLNLREIEQMVDQLNRLPSNQAQMELAPGKAVGGSEVLVKNHPQKPWRVGLARHNDGQRSTGEQQWGTSLDWDNPLGLADQLSLRGGHDASSDHQKTSRNAMLYYNLPFGWWNLSYTYSESEYRSLAKASGFDFKQTGDSQNHQLKLERVIYRDGLSKTSLNTGLSYLRTNNFIEDSKLDLSSNRISEAQLGINHGRRIGGAFVNVDLGMQEGIGAFDAQGNHDPKPGQTDARYRKYTATLSYLQPFKLWGESLSLSSLMTGQRSEDVLFSSQRMSLGGQSSIRGYKDQTLSGDSGGYWRNDLRWTRPVAWDWVRPVFAEYGTSLSMANLNDVGGQLVTHGDLTLDGDRWTNSSSLQASHLTVNVNHLSQTATGQLLATAGLNGSGIDWNNDGQIGTDGNATLDLSGGYGGQGRLSSAGALDLHAALINLGQAGSIAGGGTSTVNVDGVLTSHGRLTSAADMTLNAAAIDNYGALGGAQKLTATTGALLNDHGLIFSGGDMGLRVDSLSNSYASIYSLGNLSIDRDGQGALASRIVNSSGSIQSDASMSLTASTIQNVRAVLTTNNQGIYTASIVEVQCIEGYNAGDCGGKQNHVWQITQRDKFEVTEASAASSITSGTHLSIQGGDLLNQSSTISAGGALSATVLNLTNSGIETGETETSRTFMSERTRNADMWYASAAAFNNSYWLQSAGYNPNNLGGLPGALSGFIGLTEIELSQFRTSRNIASSDQSYAAVIQAGGAVSVNAQNGFSSSVVRAGYTYVGAGPRTDTQAPANTFSTHLTVNRQLPPDLAQQQVNPLSLPGFSLPVGENGLFRLSGQTSTANQPAVHVPGLPDTSGRSSPQKYLIETNPLLTDLKQFMSSDYLLSNLGYDPQASAKRLGDGFYEQKLIQQAVTARTGQRFIDGQTSDDDMFKYLMNNAVASKQQLDLQLGVSLTSEQVAALTHDIVWMENATMNGEQVLVPVLYLANADNRLAANGALIQGSDVTLIAGKDLVNAGTLRASSNFTVAAGNDLVNSGLLEANNRLDALAGDSLTNKAGGIIAGRDVSVTAVVGDVTNERTITTHESSTGYKTEQRTFADNAAMIEATQSLSVTAGRDLDNIGGLLKSGTDTTLKANRDVNITSVEEINSNTRGTRYRDQSITQDSSSVWSGGNLTVNAGRDLTAVASQIEAKHDVTLSAVDNLTLASAADEEHDYSKTKKVTSQLDHVSQVASSVSAGGAVRLNAGNDLMLVSSKVDATTEAYLVAGGKLGLLAAQNSDYSLYDMKKKGSWGRKKTQHDQVTQVTNVGSEIQAGGDIGLISSGDQHYQAAKLESGNDLTLQSGGSISLEGVKDLHQEDHAKSSTSLAWNTMKGKGSTNETLQQTQMSAKGQMVIKAVDGLHIDVKQVNEQTVSQAIDAMVQADPQLAWLKEAERRGDVDWRQIKEVHDSYKYSSSSLGVGAMLAIIIIVTVLTAGAASGAIGTVAGAGAEAGSGAALAAAGSEAMVVAGTAVGTVSAGWANVALTSVLTSMASTAAVSTVNDRGDLGAALKDTFSRDSLKNAAIGGLTAGAISYADSTWFRSAEAATNGGSQVIGAGPIQNPGYSSDMLTWGNATDTIVRSGAHAVISSGISTAINGGSFGGNLGSALINEGIDFAAAAGNKSVGDLAKILNADPGTAQTILLHAALGGLISVAKGQDFTSGAIAGGVADGLTPIANGLLAQYASDLFASDNLSQQGSQSKIATAQIIGLISASLAGGDASTGSMIGGYGEKYNLLLHAQEIQDAAKKLFTTTKGGNPEGDIAGQDPTNQSDGIGMPIGGSSSVNPANQTALMAAALMGGFAGRFGALASVSMEEALASLPAFGGLFSEVGEGVTEGGLTSGSAITSAEATGEGSDAVIRLSQGQQRAINKIDNILNNFKSSDIEGALKDMAGEPVPKNDGTYWDHLKEMNDTLRGLRNHAETLKGLGDPAAQAARQQALDAIDRVESAMKGFGI
ncbi:ShlB/FhaC/HecB family hemolysin secretion/activation protein [Pseudomonas agarici]|uniref:ShlB/FhaC/HecB family hemolysin secretion/activation protein n=1 Tax=Pseudomonas agarici TaxID=46677 RepID=UPI0009E8E9AB|nr:ShlB/FhaC/HecB family hemolysin secretion/activation protein [Pseudomonas agarici]